MSFFVGFADELIKLAQIPTRQRAKHSGSLAQVAQAAKQQASPEARKAQLREKYRQIKPPKPKPKMPTHMPVFGT